MITHYAFDNLGGANHGWLDAKHHFSFASYHDANRMSHGELLVINDDRIAPQTGFGMHPHADMEIITYVRRGAITHEDNQGNRGRTVAGDVQVMSAGTGIYHSEYNLEDEETNIYQIWITPKTMSIAPRWAAAEFPKTPVDDQLNLLVSSHEAGDAPLSINQDARIYAGTIRDGTSLIHKVSGKAYLLVAEGSIAVNGKCGTKGDGFAISDEPKLILEAQDDSEILIIEVPGLVEAR